MRSFPSLALLALVAGFLLTSCANRYEPPWAPGPSAAKLVDLMGERLVLSQEIAWTKYKSGLPVTDRKREKQSMSSLLAKGRALGLPPARVKRFFGYQFAASRMVQSQLISGWRTGAALPARAPRSLDNDLRPKMDSLNEALLLQLAAVGASGRSFELATRAERYLLALDIPHPATLKAVAPLR